MTSHRFFRFCYAAVFWATTITLTTTCAADRDAIDQKVQPVIDEVDKICRQHTVYMIGPEKAKRRAKLVRQRKPAVVVADNVGMGAEGMKDYLDHVRSRYRSKTERFDIDLPWGKRDAMEVTIIESKGGNEKP